MKEKKEVDLSWMVPIEVMLGALHHGQVQACSISRVPEKLRDQKEHAFKPKEVSIGPLHRGTQLMEETKWHYMRQFLERKGTQRQNKKSELRLRECGNDILKLDKLITASYGGHVEAQPQDLAKIMIVDGCFLLEFLISLGDYITQTQTESIRFSKDLVLKNKEKVLCVLNDITMLENQIPFIVLKKLYRKVYPDDSDVDQDHRVANIVRKAFGFSEVNHSGGVHVLHLMHVSTVGHHHDEGKRAKQELLRCATRLKAAGITIKASKHTPCHELLDTFNFGIDFTNAGVLQIPVLNVKETTEVRWRNLIAWEQSKISLKCQYTSYALFFQGLICCKHDIEFLEEIGVIVNYAKKSKEELLNLFQTIAKGAERMDSSYSKDCDKLNEYHGKKVRTVLGKLPIVFWHKCRHVFEIVMYYWGNWYKILIRDHIPTVWKFIGVLAAAALLVLAVLQTYYSSRVQRGKETRCTFPPSQTLSFELSFLAMASLLLAAPPPLSIHSHTSSSHLSFSQSQSLFTPLFTPFPSFSASAAPSLSPTPSVYCGRGDRKTERGKRFNHSFGNARPKDKKKGRGPPRLHAPPAPKKDRFEDNEVVKIEIDESLFSG
ncbi:hypothetical protein RJT34_22241 [Clitoria ternatea]|uniref:Uncharacterized protein n=1 Tax=Clitoria ternatea TaxID=43366 RepID=A0AAN9IV79_CLITE